MSSNTIRWNRVLLEEILCGVAWCFFLLVCFFLYLPGLDGGYLLDDWSTLGKIAEIDWSITPFFEPVFEESSGPLGRPIGMFLFVLERVYFPEAIWSYKLNSLALHMINGCLALWLFYLLFAWKSHKHAPALAVLAAGMWLFAPLHVSTVLYLVQRFTMLSALFMLVALIGYIKWRYSLRYARPSYIWLLVSFSAILAGPFAKENAVLVVPIIVACEALWLDFDCGNETHRRERLKSTYIVLVFLGLAIFVLALSTQAVGIAKSYNLRDFDILQRVLSQFRILWDYAGQFYWPDLSRLGVYHDDYQISRGLFDPISTFYAVASWFAVGLLILFMSVTRSFKVLAFLPCLFLIAHSLESTVFPLELYFEHRNYFPSIALALFPSTILMLLVNAGLHSWRPLFVWTMFLVILLIFKASSQAVIWSGSTMLSVHHLAGHPKSARANSDFAGRLATNGELEMAKQYSLKAYKYSGENEAAKSNGVGDWVLRDVLLNCMANQEISASDFQPLLLTSEIRPITHSHTLREILVAMNENRCPHTNWEVFSDAMSKVFLDNPDSNRAFSEVYAHLSAVDNLLGNYERALHYIELRLVRSPRDPQGLLMKLHFLSTLGMVEDAHVVRSLLIGEAQAGKLTAQQKRTLNLY